MEGLAVLVAVVVARQGIFQAREALAVARVGATGVLYRLARLARSVDQVVTV